jgi:hypothetical protein
LIQIRHLVWAAALALSIGVAILLYGFAGFGRLGPRGGLDAVGEALVAFCIALVSQAGLGVAPFARSRGPWLRAIATVLMIPSLAFSFAAYRGLLARTPDQEAVASIDWVILTFLCIAPVYVGALVWMWLAPRPGGAART